MSREQVLDANDWLDALEEAQDVSQRKARAKAEADGKRRTGR